MINITLPDGSIKKYPKGTHPMAVATVGSQSGSLPLMLSGRVSSISLDATGTNLTLNTSALGAVAMSDVRRVM